MWVPKLLLSPVKVRILCPKTTKFGPKLSFLVILVEALPALLVPCWWVGWWLWRACCISQDTYLLYINIIHLKNNLMLTPKEDLIIRIISESYVINSDLDAKSHFDFICFQHQNRTLFFCLAVTIVILFSAS